MLQRFLGSLRYIANFYKDLAKNCALLYNKLKKEEKKTKEEKATSVDPSSHLSCQKNKT